MMKYEAVIGLEVHVQIKTKSKLFSGSKYSFGEEPNTLTDPVVLGLPGSLPMLNKEAVLKTIKAGLIFGCDIADLAKWGRKNIKSLKIHTRFAEMGTLRSNLMDHREISWENIKK